MTRTVNAESLKVDLARQAKALRTSRETSISIAIRMRGTMRQAYEAGVSYNELERVTGLAAETVRRWVDRGEPTSS